MAEKIFSMGGKVVPEKEIKASLVDHKQILRSRGHNLPYSLIVPSAFPRELVLTQW